MVIDKAQELLFIPAFSVLSFPKYKVPVNIQVHSPTTSNLHTTTQTSVEFQQHGTVTHQFRDASGISH
jgi:hypothetical protein